MGNPGVVYQYVKCTDVFKRGNRCFLVRNIYCMQRSFTTVLYYDETDFLYLFQRYAFLRPVLQAPPLYDCTNSYQNRDPRMDYNFMISDRAITPYSYTAFPVDAQGFMCTKRKILLPVLINFGRNRKQN
jgi:hypothetical protein